MTSSLASVAILARGGIAPLFIPVDDPTSLVTGNFGVVVDSIGAVEAVAELPPKEKP